MKEVRLLHCGCRNFSHFVYNRMVLMKLASIDRNQATGSFGEKFRIQSKLPIRSPGPSPLSACYFVCVLDMH